MAFCNQNSIKSRFEIFPIDFHNSKQVILMVHVLRCKSGCSDRDRNLLRVSARVGVQQRLVHESDPQDPMPRNWSL